MIIKTRKRKEKKKEDTQMKKRLMVLAMAGIMVTGLVSSANIVSADDKIGRAHV